jgi:hypothetical protein
MQSDSCNWRLDLSTNPRRLTQTVPVRLRARVRDQRVCSAKLHSSLSGVVSYRTLWAAKPILSATGIFRQFARGICFIRPNSKPMTEQRSTYLFSDDALRLAASPLPYGAHHLPSVPRRSVCSHVLARDDAISPGSRVPQRSTPCSFLLRVDDARWFSQSLGQLSEILHVASSRPNKS